MLIENNPVQILFENNLVQISFSNNLVQILFENNLAQINHFILCLLHIIEIYYILN